MSSRSKKQDMLRLSVGRGDALDMSLVPIKAENEDIVDDAAMRSSLKLEKEITEEEKVETPKPVVHSVEIDKESARKAAAAAIRLVKKATDKSNVIRADGKDDGVARFSHEEVGWGALLGRGGFADVHEIEILDTSKPLSTAPKESFFRTSFQLNVPQSVDEQRRKFVSDNLRREEGNHDARYAIKFLSRETMMNPVKYRTGAADLALEAKFLASLDHPNIVKIRGIPNEGEKGFLRPVLGGFFIIMDRLYNTLDEQIHVTWKKEKDAFPSSKRFMCKAPDPVVAQKKEDLLLRRLTAMFDIAGAFSYMHQHNIVYRDAKPENAGIDVRGDVKIFDFGLAKELTSDVEMEDGTYKVTGETGSLRYMAPEVKSCKPYNVSADVHSVAIIFWEMMSFKTPFLGLTKRDFEIEVVELNLRPTIKNSWPPAIKSLIRKGWSPKPTDRPTMSEICADIRKMIVGIKGGDEKGLNHVSRRSTHILDVKKTQNGLLSKSTVMGLSESVKLDFQFGLDEIEESDEEGST
eukprot:scaffold421227_cov54-Attheya_sp.AAC.2